MLNVGRALPLRSESDASLLLIRVLMPTVHPETPEVFASRLRVNLQILAPGSVD